jgi:hypothetical protein
VGLGMMGRRSTRRQQQAAEACTKCNSIYGQRRGVCQFLHHPLCCRLLGGRTNRSAITHLLQDQLWRHGDLLPLVVTGVVD